MILQHQTIPLDIGAIPRSTDSTKPPHSTWCLLRTSIITPTLNVNNTATTMSPNLIHPRAADLNNLTDSQLHSLVADEHRRHSFPPWYVLYMIWLFFMIAFGISNMLPPRHCISHYLRLPDRLFRWTPGKQKFDLEWDVKENI